MKTLGLTLLAWLTVTAAWAREDLPDPTRPSNFQSSSSSRTHNAEAQVQLISISSKRRFAVIDGQEVQVGGMIGPAKVVKITENEVVLDAPAGRKTLYLYPWQHGIDGPKIDGPKPSSPPTGTPLPAAKANPPTGTAATSPPTIVPASGIPPAVIPMLLNAASALAVSTSPSK